MPSSEAWRWRKHHVVAGGIALVGGYADVISLHRWKCFATMCTGNTIWLGRVLLGHSVDSGELHGPVFYTCIIIAFLFGAALHRWADRRWQHRGATRVGPLLGAVNLTCEIVVFFCATESFLHRFPYLVVLYTPLFGVVCAASADGRLGSATTMVTGHMISLAKALADLPVKKFTYADKCKVLMSLIVLIFSIMGALVANLAFKCNGFATSGLFLPVSPLLVVLLWCHDHLARPRKLVKMYQKAMRAKQEAEKPGEGAAQLPQPESSPSQEDSPFGSDDESSTSEGVQSSTGSPQDLETGASPPTCDDGRTVSV